MTKISNYPLASAPALTDELVGNEGGTTTKRVPIGNFLGLHRGPKMTIPIGGTSSGDVTDIGSSTNSAAAHNNVICWYPLFVPESCTLTVISARVGVLEAGATCRLGVYSITSIGATSPVGSRVADFGTIYVSTTGIKNISVSQALTKGLYALCGAASNHSTVRYRRPEFAANFFLYGETSLGSFVGSVGWKDNATDYSGGLPSSFTATANVGGQDDGVVEVVATFA